MLLLHGPIFCVRACVRVCLHLHTRTCSCIICNLHATINRVSISMLVYHETHFCKSALFDMSAGTPIEIDRFVFGRSGLSSTGFRMHIRVEAADSLVLPGAEAANSYCPGSGSPVGLTRATLLNLRARKVHSNHHKKIHSKDSSTMTCARAACATYARLLPTRCTRRFVETPSPLHLATFGTM